MLVIRFPLIIHFLFLAFLALFSSSNSVAEPLVAHTSGEVAKTRAQTSSDGIIFECSGEKLKRIKVEMAELIKSFGWDEDVYEIIEESGRLQYRLKDKGHGSNTLNLCEREDLKIEPETVVTKRKGKDKEVEIASKNEITAALMHQGRTTTFNGNNCSFPSFMDHVLMRQGVAKASATALLEFPEEGPVDFNPFWWDKERNVVKGKDVTDALNDIFQGRYDYVIGCTTTVKAAILQGAMSHMKDSPQGKKLMNTLAGPEKDPLGRYEEYLASAKNVPHDNWIVGDWGYIKNRDAQSSAQRGYEGSNIMYVGCGKFGAYYTGRRDRTLNESISKVYHWKNGVELSLDELPEKELEEFYKDPDVSPRGMVSNERDFPKHFPVTVYESSLTDKEVQEISASHEKKLSRLPKNEEVKSDDPATVSAIQGIADLANKSSNSSIVRPSEPSLTSPFSSERPKNFPPKTVEKIEDSVVKPNSSDEIARTVVSRQAIRNAVNPKSHTKPPIGEGSPFDELETPSHSQKLTPSEILEKAIDKDLFKNPEYSRRVARLRQLAKEIESSPKELRLVLLYGLFDEEGKEYGTTYGSFERAVDRLIGGHIGSQRPRIELEFHRNRRREFAQPHNAEDQREAVGPQMSEIEKANLQTLNSVRENRENEKLLEQLKKDRDLYTQLTTDKHTLKSKLYKGKTPNSSTYGQVEDWKKYRALVLSTAELELKIHDQQVQFNKKFAALEAVVGSVTKGQLFEKTRALKEFIETNNLREKGRLDQNLKEAKRYNQDFEAWQKKKNQPIPISVTAPYTPPVTFENSSNYSNFGSSEPAYSGRSERRAPSYPSSGGGGWNRSPPAFRGGGGGVGPPVFIGSGGGRAPVYTGSR